MKRPLRSLGLLAASVTLVLGTSATARAADLNADAILSSDLSAPSEVTVGANSFDIKLTLTGNLVSQRTVQVVNAYSMAITGVVTPNTASTTPITILVDNYSQICDGAPDQMGCPSNPFIVASTLTVAAGTPAGTAGTVVTAFGPTVSNITYKTDTGYVQTPEPSDSTPPVIVVPADITTEATGSSGAVVTYSGASATDLVDGPLPATCSPASGTTFAIGSHTVTCSATDAAGNTGSADFTITVRYGFDGFFRPIDNSTEATLVYNSVKAGQGIPVKSNLGGNMGLNIFVAGYPASRQVTCLAGAPLDTVEETVTAGNSSLSYDSLANQYNYVWKSDKTWANTCRVFNMKLKDGTEHSAYFKFLK